MSIRTGLLLLSFCGFATTAGAQDRAGSWEAGFLISDSSSEFLAGESGASLDVEGDLGYGFTFNYNATNHFAFGGDFTFTSPDYTATRETDPGNVIDGVSAELDIATLHFKGTFYFTEGSFAPFVEAGGGWSRVDSNIADGPPTTGCWWDPWWGYVCTEFYDTYSETRTSYTYGVGLRWEIADGFVARATYGILEIDTQRSEDAELDVLRVDFGWRF